MPDRRKQLLDFLPFIGIAACPALAVAAALAGLKSSESSSRTGDQDGRPSAASPPVVQVPTHLSAGPEAATVTAAPVVQPSRADLEGWLDGQPVKWSEQELVASILDLTEAERAEILSKLGEAYAREPQKFAPLARTLGLAWARTAPGLAILFLDRLREATGGGPGLMRLESQLANEWLAKGITPVGEALNEISQRGAPLPAGVLDLFTVLVQNEQRAKLDDFLKWAEGVGRENSALQVAVSEALVRTGKAENFPKIAGYLGRDVADQASADCIGKFAGRNAAAAPEEVSEWLKTLAPRVKPWAVSILGEYFEQLGAAQPAKAVELLNSGFTDLFASEPRPTPAEGASDDSPATNSAAPATGDQLYDIALTKVLNGVMPLDPDYAIACAASFNDPRLQARYEKTARRLQLSGARTRHE